MKQNIEQMCLTKTHNDSKQTTIHKSMTAEHATYLGPRGYTIHKENLDEDERKYIRTELTIRPYIPKAPVQPAAYPIYRESPLKMYVPRYFGIDAYGPPESIKISSGDQLNSTVTFQGEMRDYQKDIVRKYLNHVGAGGGGLLDVDPGKGKTVMALDRKSTRLNSSH